MEQMEDILTQENISKARRVLNKIPASHRRLLDVGVWYEGVKICQGSEKFKPVNITKLNKENDIRDEIGEYVCDDTEYVTDNGKYLKVYYTSGSKKKNKTAIKLFNNDDIRGSVIVLSDQNITCDEVKTARKTIYF